MKINKCSYYAVHPDIIKKATGSLPDDEMLHNLADFFKICGDATRIKVLHGLFVSEMCVRDLSATCGMSVSSISHQLRVLKQAKLVKSRKDGQMVYYSLNNDQVRQLFNHNIKHVLAQQ